MKFANANKLDRKSGGSPPEFLCYRPANPWQARKGNRNISFLAHVQFLLGLLGYRPRRAFCLHLIAGVNGIRCQLDHLVRGFQVSKDFDLSMDGLARLHRNPFRFAIFDPDDKGMLLVAGHRGSRDEQRGIASLQRPQQRKRNSRARAGRR